MSYPGERICIWIYRYMKKEIFKGTVSKEFLWELCPPMFEVCDVKKTCRQELKAKRALWKNSWHFRSVHTAYRRCTYIWTSKMHDELCIRCLSCLDFSLWRHRSFIQPEWKFAKFIKFTMYFWSGGNVSIFTYISVLPCFSYPNFFN